MHLKLLKVTNFQGANFASKIFQSISLFGMLARQLREYGHKNNSNWWLRNAFRGSNYKMGNLWPPSMFTRNSKKCKDPNASPCTFIQKLPQNLLAFLSKWQTNFKKHIIRNLKTHEKIKQISAKSHRASNKLISVSSILIVAFK